MGRLSAIPTWDGIYPIGVLIFTCFMRGNLLVIKRVGRRLLSLGLG
jgi:hypothetical protein